MKKITFVTIIGLSFIVGLAAACSSPAGNSTTTTNTNQVTTTSNKSNSANQATNANPSADKDVPASVKAIFPDAQFTTQHKDIPKDKIAEIEKDSGGKVPDTDHHSYLAFATKDGKRTQIGAATVVKSGGKDVVIVYDSKDGSPIIKEVRAEGVSADFLKQFAGKGHDNDILVGADIKAAGGVNEAQAKTITEAIKIDVLTMQALYGAAHTH